MRVSGIYKITNLSNEKIYIGSSINIQNRKREHFRLLRNNEHYNEYLQNAWNKHGEKNFKFEIIEKCEKEILIEREQYFLDKTRSYDRKVGYNICKLADSTTGIKNKYKGILRKKETKEKISKKVSGEFNSQAKLSRQQVKEIRELYSTNEYFYKEIAEIYNVSSGTIQKIIENISWIDKDYKKTAGKRRIGENNSFFGKAPKNKGTQLSKEVKEKIGKNNRKKLSFQKAEEIRNKYFNLFYSQYELGKEYNVSRSTIKAILNERIWKREKKEQIKKKFSIKLNFDKAQEIRKKYSNENYTYKKLSDEYKVKIPTIQDVIQNKTWKETK